MRSVIYGWQIQFGQGFQSGPYVIDLLLEGDRGVRPFAALRDERNWVKHQVAPGSLSSGRLPEGSAVGNLEHGKLMVEGTKAVVIEWIRIQGDGAVWLASGVGQVIGVKELSFVIESEESTSPLNIRKKVAADEALKLSDPEEWKDRNRTTDKLLSSIGIVPRTEEQLEKVIDRARRSAVVKAPQESVRSEVQDRQTALALPMQTVSQQRPLSPSELQGNPLADEVLTALRASGYTDEQIVAMSSGGAVTGQTLSGAEGRRMPAQQGQTLRGESPDYGSGYEGFVSLGAAGARLDEV